MLTRKHVTEKIFKAVLADERITFQIEKNITITVLKEAPQGMDDGYKKRPEKRFEKRPEKRFEKRTEKRSDKGPEKRPEKNVFAKSDKLEKNRNFEDKPKWLYVQPDAHQARIGRDEQRGAVFSERGVGRSRGRQECSQVLPIRVDDQHAAAGARQVDVPLLVDGHPVAP